MGQPLPLSYWDYLQAIVSRYASSPALGMWEPVNEPEASSCPGSPATTACSGHQTCPDEAAAAGALRAFFDRVGGEIHALDPAGVIEAGFLGGGQCGTSGPDYAYVGASPGIDVLSVHDYYPADAAIGGDEWNGIAVRAAQARADDKPLVVGEVGIAAGPGAGCLSTGQRAADLSVRLAAQAQLGIAAWLFWDWVASPTGSCSYDIGPGDAALGLLGPR
jgi:mannan endo-1,4-beta-mannosidase